MIQIKNLTITHKKDLRTIISDFNLTLNDGDKAVLIGEEGNGKSSIIKWIYDPALIENYAEFIGERIINNQKLAYLPQELTDPDKEKTLYEYFSENDLIYDVDPGEAGKLATEFGLDSGFFYDERKLGVLSGGEKVKALLMKIILSKPDVLLLDEPSNDIDIDTLDLLQRTILNWKKIVLFVSHDEKLIRNTANMIIHIEQIERKTKCRYTVAKKSYDDYINERANLFERQANLATNEKREKKERDEKADKIYKSVDHALDVISRGDPTGARLLKKKMHAVKSMEKRFEREDENMTKEPEQEEAIYFKLGDKNSANPSTKTIIDINIPELTTADNSRVLARNISLKLMGNDKVCIIGKNGAGKTTLLKKIAEELNNRSDIAVEYMPQNYEEMLDLAVTPVDFLDTTGDKEERTKIRTYLGSLKYTADEMDHEIKELSGGQKAKILLLKMSLSHANVLLLDEPTRNFSPLSGPVIRKMLRDFPGAIISISHDRTYIEEVCDKVYRLDENGLTESDMRGKVIGREESWNYEY